MKPRLSFRLLLLALALCVSAPAMAETALQKARRLTALSDPAAQTADMMAALRPQMVAQLRAQAASRGRALSRAALQDVESILSEETRRLTNAMRAKMPGVYAEMLTLEEIDALITFYETPSGRAVMAKLPLVAQASMGAMDADILAFQTRVSDRLRAAAAR